VAVGPERLAHVTATRSFDVIVVGSGPAGGYAAKALTEAGLQVLVLDAGPDRRVSQIVDRYDTVRRRLGYRIEEDPAAIVRQPVQSGCYAWPQHPHAFVDDLDNPFTIEQGQRFAWIRSRQFGGRMMVRGHGLQFYRLSDFDFKAGDRDGASASWPISYADLVPYYERVERWMALRGTRNELAHLPDSILSAEVGLGAGEQLLHAALTRTWPDRTLIPGRTASPPVPIVDAIARPNCTLRSRSVVTRVSVDPDTAKANGVEYVDTATGRTREARARAIVLCASAIESARLLLASANHQHPNGLGNSSDMLGRYLMDHTHLNRIDADMPITASDGAMARRWAYIPCFRNVTKPNGSYVRGYGIQVFTEGSQCGLTVFGEMLPRHDNRVTLDPHHKDRWGVPVARISCTHGPNEQAMLADQVVACNEILEAARLVPWRVNAELSPPGLANHEMGTARMGADPRTSVLNSFCQSWDVKNLFVMDGACFVSQACQNPTLTILALAARSSEYLLASFRDL
jgi:choline dehydrogenase-like flavoprotein